MQLPLESEADMRLPGFVIGQDLNAYLSSLRKLVFSRNSDVEVTIVLGNPSCDLDSFICSFVLSYFYNGRPNLSKHHKNPIYVPVLNLPYTSPSELWRLRPEFGVALKAAFDGISPQTEADVRGSESTRADYSRLYQQVTEQLFTIHELANNDKTLPSLQAAFQPSENPDQQRSVETKQATILVDHNAPAIESINQNDLKTRLDVVGCIDHHVEERYVSEHAHPRIIRLGIGSCMTLVTEHLRSLNLWKANTDSKQSPGFQQLARLALTPVLIDTWNLKAPGDKCSELDKQEAGFLQSQTGDGFDPDDLFEQANTAKLESVNLLHMQEIFARDYKSYVEVTKEEKDINIGIASVVQDLQWMCGHAKGKEKFVDQVIKYARDAEKVLGSFAILTRSGERKQLCVFAFDKTCQKSISRFEHTAGELRLEQWKGDEELAHIFDKKIGADSWKVWWMNDTSKSRKQVAPLLRQAIEHSIEKK